MLRLINWLMDRHLARREREHAQTIRLLDAIRQVETTLADEVEAWLNDEEGED